VATKKNLSHTHRSTNRGYKNRPDRPTRNVKTDWATKICYPFKQKQRFFFFDKCKIKGFSFIFSWNNISDRTNTVKTLFSSRCLCLVFKIPPSLGTLFSSQNSLFLFHLLYLYMSLLHRILYG
jgi:hypothetical protein